MSSKQEKKLSNSNWLPHDLDTTADPKVIALLGEHGGMGYAVFWRLNEILHKEKDKGHTVGMEDAFIFQAIASQFKISVEQVNTIVTFCISNVCQLFKVDENGRVYSERVFRNIGRKNEVSEIRREAIRKRWGAEKKSNTNVSASNTSANKRIQSDTDKRRGEEIIPKRDIISDPIPVPTQNGTAGPGAFEGSGPPASQASDHAQRVREYEALLQRDREQAEKNLRAFKAKLAKAGLKLDDEIRQKFEELPLIRQEQMYLQFHRDYLLEGKDAEKQDVMNLINDYNPDHDESGAAD